MRWHEIEFGSSKDEPRWKTTPQTDLSMVDSSAWSKIGQKWRDRRADFLSDGFSISPLLHVSWHLVHYESLLVEQQMSLKQQSGQRKAGERRPLPEIWRNWQWFVRCFIKQPIQVLPASFIYNEDEFRNHLVINRKYSPTNCRSSGEKARNQKRFKRFCQDIWIFYNLCLHPNLCFEIFNTDSERGFGVRFRTSPPIRHWYFGPVLQGGCRSG